MFVCLGSLFEAIVRKVRPSGNSRKAENASEVDPLLPTSQRQARNPPSIDTTVAITSANDDDVFIPQISLRTPTYPTQPSDDGFLPRSPGSLVPSRPSRRNSVSSSSAHTRSDSKDSSKSFHQLKAQLEAARIESPRRPHSFLVSRQTQQELITEATILKDIQARNPRIDETQARKYASKACGCAKKLYATLAYIKQGAEICALLDEGISDEDLPLQRIPSPKSRFALHRKTGEPIITLDRWPDKYLEKFDRVQWWMTSPVFEETEHYELDDKTVLPFIPFETTPDSKGKEQGAYSEVYPVCIHPAHHEFWNHFNTEPKPLVAVKQLFSDDDEEFQKEVTILKKLGDRNHPHLIKLLATYKQEQKYHLMFPWADANLRKYWDDRKTPAFDSETVLWSLKQMLGMSNALLLIHNFKVTYPLSVPGAGNIRRPKDALLSVSKGEEMYGRHGDIKPENVLWFSKQEAGGTLRIADFGLGRFHGRDSRSGVNPDHIVSSPTYEPPECKLRKPVSRAYDIWSLGCLYLEFVTWLLKGSAAIDNFSNTRGREATGTGINDDYFYTILTNISGTKATVREGVTLWVEQLHEHERCSALIHDLLDLIMRELLVIESKNRVNANELYQQLRLLLKNAECGESYMLNPAQYVSKQPPAERSNSSPEANSRTANIRLRMTPVRESEAWSIRNTTLFPPPIETLPKDLVLRGTPTSGNGRGSTWPIMKSVNSPPAPRTE